MRRLEHKIETAHGFTTLPARELNPKPNKRGYVRVTIGNKAYSLHRLVARAFHGVPENEDELLVMHLNDDPSDNRVDNLRWGTSKDNQQDAVNKGRHSMLKKTHCPKGHPYDEENTYIRPNGNRKCQTCHRELSRARALQGLRAGDLRHGTSNGYDNYKCRCDACKEAKRKRSRK